MAKIIEQKKQLRQHFRKIRDGVQQERGSRWGLEEKSLLWSFLGGVEFPFEGPVLSFFPIDSEPVLLPAAGQPEARLQWFFPAISGKNLWWFSWSPADPLPAASERGLRESESAADFSAAWQSVCGICFVPALAVDAQGYRLGYGGGYYDRFFGSSALRKNFLLVSCMHPFLLVQELPHEAHDVPVDMVVTLDGVTTFGDVTQILKKLGTTKVDASKSELL